MRFCVRKGYCFGRVHGGNFLYRVETKQCEKKKENTVVSVLKSVTFSISNLLEAVHFNIQDMMPKV